MKVAMLGWEFPPHISGGLGTACEGLTKALAKVGTEVTFVVPHLFGGEVASHMRLLTSRGEPASGKEKRIGQNSRRLIKIRSSLSPYLSPQGYSDWVKRLLEQRADTLSSAALNSIFSEEFETPDPQERYGRDIFEEVHRYASEVINLLGTEDFDIIHAHDWMTFPAAIALATLTGKPLIVHIHSLEFDRSGGGANAQISEIEKWGMISATKVIAVSYYTRALIHRIHNVPLDKIEVVHNGVYAPHVVSTYRKQKGFPSRIVLFLGRITFQKGPDYFVEAAAQVIPQVEDVLFVMAGAGDMLPQINRRIKELGIERNFYFPGFLRGHEVEQMFSLADVYVMPSVSEPFGISALEAISHDTPVIISRQSGVSEVLGHALKVDFWDVEKLADLIVNALIHRELREDMVTMAREEVKRVHWDASAIKTQDIYKKVLR